MSEHDTSYAIFIDYDNLEPAQKAAGILDVVTKALVQIPLDGATIRAKCDIRIYGGWYEGTEITRKAEDITIEIQRDFPKIIRLPLSGQRHVAVSANAELAVALLQEPGHHMFDTFRRKGNPNNVRVEGPAVVGCTDPECALLMMKKLLKTGKCPKTKCSVTVGNLIFRHEQKIVDTMLSCDLIHAASGIYKWIILVSGDDDFLPPLRTILLKGAAAARFHPKPNCQHASFPQGPQLLEKDL